MSSMAQRMKVGDRWTRQVEKETIMTAIKIAIFSVCSKNIMRNGKLFIVTKLYCFILNMMKRVAIKTMD